MKELDETMDKIGISLVELQHGLPIHILTIVTVLKVSTF